MKLRPSMLSHCLLISIVIDGAWFNRCNTSILISADHSGSNEAENQHVEPQLAVWLVKIGDMIEYTYTML